MGSEGKLFINGEWQAPASGRLFETINPATGEVLSQVGEADVDDVDRAVWAARAAFEGAWGRAPASERERMLRGVAGLIEKHQAELARLETLDTGKPIREAARIDIPAAARAFYYYAGLATKIEGNVYPVPGNFLVYGVWEYRRAETVGTHPPDGLTAGGTVRRSRCAAGCGECSPRIWPDGRGRARATSRRGEGGLHGLGRDRPVYYAGGGGDPQKGESRAGREIPQHLLPRHESGGGH